MPTIRRTRVERAMAKVEPEPNTGCWLWTGATTGGERPGSYGQLRLDRRMVLAHRAMYEAFVGAIPDGMHVLHRCDTPLCVNPAHLFVGTQRDNMRDRDAKHRRVAPRGERHWAARLTADAVRRIRARWADGEAQAAIARDYGVSGCAVHLIVHRKNWTRV